jgi:hypothetical protein
MVRVRTPAASIVISNKLRVAGRSSCLFFGCLLFGKLVVDSVVVVVDDMHARNLLQSITISLYIAMFYFCGTALRAPSGCCAIVKGILATTTNNNHAYKVIHLASYTHAQPSLRHGYMIVVAANLNV